MKDALIAGAMLSPEVVGYSMLAAVAIGLAARLPRGWKGKVVALFITTTAGMAPLLAARDVSPHSAFVEAISLTAPGNAAWSEDSSRVAVCGVNDALALSG